MQQKNLIPDVQSNKKLTILPQLQPLPSTFDFNPPQNPNLVKPSSPLPQLQIASPRGWNPVKSPQYIKSFSNNESLSFEIKNSTSQFYQPQVSKKKFIHY